jgi:hypothetical protein
MATSRIAILGWGSLLWEPHAEFDKWHDSWKSDGPEIPLEFSRISSSRLGALTLVIDHAHGQATTVSYSMSKRLSLDEALVDLRCREGATLSSIGFVCRGGAGNRAREEKTKAAISAWVDRTLDIDAVVWTDLKSNFEEKSGKPFSIDAAISYLQNLNVVAKVKAAEYAWRAPPFVRTPLREALETKPWFP